MEEVGVVGEVGVVVGEGMRVDSQESLVGSCTLQQLFVIQRAKRKQ